MSPPGPSPASGSPAALKEVARRGQALIRTPPGDRDLRWHVEAFLVGDLPALLAAEVRAERLHA